MAITYVEKLKDPRWQKKRLEVMQRDQFTCRHCGNDKVELQIHHIKYYSGFEPWEYHNSDLLTLCKHCHSKEGACRKAHEEYLVDVMNRSGFSADEVLSLAQFMDKYPGVVIDIRRIIDESINLEL